MGEPVSERRDYDCMGRVTKETDPRGGVTETEYDRLGRVVQMTFPETEGKRDFKLAQYNDLQNCAEFTDERGFRRRVQYTQLGLPRYVYTGARAGLNADILLTEYRYDGIERLISERTFDGNVLFSTEYSYDAYDRVTAKAIPAVDYLSPHVAVLRPVRRGRICRVRFPEYPHLMPEIFLSVPGIVLIPAHLGVTVPFQVIHGRNCLRKKCPLCGHFEKLL